MISLGWTASAAAYSAVITGGSIDLGDPSFTLSWNLTTDKTSVEQLEPPSSIVFNLTWKGDKTTWAAFGLHPKPGLGMPNAEVFMCSGTFCQARNTLAGFDVPAVETHQYLRDVAFQQTSSSTSAIFSRTIAAAPGAAAPLSKRST